MSFFDTAARAKAYLHTHGRVSLRALRREFALDDAELDELIEELVEVQRVAVREGAVLVSTTAVQSGSVPTARAMDATAAVAASSSGPGDQERRQLTVLFCDLVGSTELSTRLDAD